MSLSRRGFMAQGSIIAAGFIANHLSGFEVFALQAVGTPPKRRTLNGMALNDPILVAWREGVRKLKALPAGNTFNWTKLSTIHGTAAGFNKCPHGNWYFLPWHRAYITMYERKVRELTAFNGFALPYWDWTSQPTLPSAFTAPTFNGQPNPLFVSSRTLTGALPSSIVGQSVINTILVQTPFETFGTSRPQGQNSLAQSWITNRSGVQGVLEATPHNNVHNLVGGFMPSTRSPLDPIFMMHHGNLDRIWAVWIAAGFANSTNALWTDMPFTNHFFNNDGTSWSPKVSDLLVPETLGYTYGLGGAGRMMATPTPPQAARFERFFAMSAGETVQGIELYKSPNKVAATAAKPLTVPVKVRAEALRNLVGRAPSAGEDLLIFSQQRTPDTAIAKAVAVIRNVSVTKERSTQFRVFLNAKNLSQATPITDPSYVGIFGFFGGNIHEGHEAEKPSVLVDLTAAIGRLTTPGSQPPDQLLVQILPAPSGKASLADVGTAAPEAVEVAIISE